MFVDRPTILRARISMALAGDYPRGYGAAQLVNMVLRTPMPVSEVRSVLDGMVLDGLAARGSEPRPFPHAPCEVFLAGRCLVGKGGGAC
jgi:hypothetical protein